MSACARRGAWGTASWAPAGAGGPRHRRLPAALAATLDAAPPSGDAHSSAKGGRAVGRGAVHACTPWGRPAHGDARAPHPHSLLPPLPSLPCRSLLARADEVLSEPGRELLLASVLARSLGTA